MRIAEGAQNVMFLPLQPLDRLNDLLNLADIHILSQVAGAADLVMPSKLTGMMASGRPVIATASPHTQISMVVQGRGIVTPPGDTESMSLAIRRLADDRTLRLRMGNEAREYATSCMARDKILFEFETAMIATRNQPHPQGRVLRDPEDNKV
jgi:colanic acid biosynthesis glycosyl transferase WcaI